MLDTTLVGTLLARPELSARLERLPRVQRAWALLPRLEQRSEQA